MTGPRSRRGGSTAVRRSTGRPLSRAASRPVPAGRDTPGRPAQRPTGRRAARVAAAGRAARRPLFSGRTALLVGLVLLLALLHAYIGWRIVPDLGAGAGAYPVADQRFMTSHALADNAHGYVFQTLADLGIVGLLVSLAVAVLWCLSAGRSAGPWRRRAHCVAQHRDRFMQTGGNGVGHAGSPALILRLDLDHRNLCRQNAEAVTDDQQIVQANHAGHTFRNPHLDLVPVGQASIPTVAINLHWFAGTPDSSDQNNPVVERDIPKAVNSSDRAAGAEIINFNSGRPLQLLKVLQHFQSNRQIA